MFQNQTPSFYFIFSFKFFIMGDFSHIQKTENRLRNPCIPNMATCVQVISYIPPYTCPLATGFLKQSRASYLSSINPSEVRGSSQGFGEWMGHRSVERKQCGIWNEDEIRKGLDRKRTVYTEPGGCYAG